MPGISGLGSSCSGNLCRLTLLSWSIAPRRRMRTGTLASWPNLRGVAPLFHPGAAGPGGRQGRGGSAPAGRSRVLGRPPAPLPPCLRCKGRDRQGRRGESFLGIQSSWRLLRCLEIVVRRAVRTRLRHQHRHPGFRLPSPVWLGPEREHQLRWGQGWRRFNARTKINPNGHEKSTTVVYFLAAGLLFCLTTEISPSSLRYCRNLQELLGTHLLLLFNKIVLNL